MHRRLVPLVGDRTRDLAPGPREERWSTQLSDQPADCHRAAFPNRKDRRSEIRNLWWRGCQLRLRCTAKYRADTKAGLHGGPDPGPPFRQNQDIPTDSRTEITRARLPMHGLGAARQRWRVHCTVSEHKSSMNQRPASTNHRARRTSRSWQATLLHSGRPSATRKRLRGWLPRRRAGAAGRGGRNWRSASFHSSEGFASKADLVVAELRRRARQLRSM